MVKQNKNIMLGLGVVVVLVVVFFLVSPPDNLTTSSIASVETPENVGTIDGTTITCPVGFTVVSTMGGTPDQLQEPKCKAPNPSVEEFSCGDSIVDADGTLFTIECSSTTVQSPTSSWSP